MASEEGRGQTRGLRTPGVAGRQEAKVPESKLLESDARECDRHVGEGEDSEAEPEYRGTRGILWEAGGTTPQA